MDNFEQDLLLETRLILDLNQGPGGYQPSASKNHGIYRDIWKLEARMAKQRSQATLRRGCRRANHLKHVDHRDGKLRGELEKAEEATRKLREERSDTNKKLLDIARNNRARRQANASAREQANSNLEMEREDTEIQRIRKAIVRGCNFLRSDQEAQSGRQLLGSQRNWMQLYSVLIIRQNSCVKRMSLLN